MPITYNENIFSSPDDLEHWSDAHETDPDIASAISQLARDETEMEDLWRGSRPPGFLNALVEILTEGGSLVLDMAACWGDTNLGSVLADVVPVSAYGISIPRLNR